MTEGLKEVARPNRVIRGRPLAGILGNPIARGGMTREQVNKGKIVGDSWTRGILPAEVCDNSDKGIEISPILFELRAK